jgi:hypothetical protein
MNTSPQVVSGSQGFEGDNSEFGFELEPRSNPSFCNTTMIGARQQTGGNAAGRAAINTRRGTAGKIYNTLMMDWTNGFKIDDASTLNQACTGSGLKTTEPFLAVKNVKMFNVANGSADVSTGGASGGPAFCPTADDLYNRWGNAGLISPACNLGNAGCTGGGTPCSCCTGSGTGTCDATDPQLGGVPEGTAGGITATFPSSVDDRYFPAAGTLSATPCGLEPDFYDQTANYIGAFKPGGSTGSGDNWLVGSWVNFGIQ